MPRRKSGEAASRFGTNGTIGRAVRAALGDVGQGDGVRGVRVALARRIADAADTAASSGDVREFVTAAKLLEEVLGKIGGDDDGTRSGVGGSPRSGRVEPEPMVPAGLGDLLGAGPQVGDSSDA